MPLEPGDVTQSSAPINPFFMQQQHRIPPKEVVMETQIFVNRNPGTVEELHRAIKEISPMPFEGIRYTLNRGLSQHLQSSHKFHVCDPQNSKYSFGSTFVGNTEVRAQEVTPVIMAEMDSASNLSFQAIHNFGKHWKTRAVIQTQKDLWAGLQLDSTFYGSNYSVQNTCVNVNPTDASGIFVSSYLHRLHPNFDTGVDLLFQRAPGGAQHIAISSLHARLCGGSNPYAKPSPIGISYPSPKWTSALSAGINGWHLSYHRNCSEYVQAGVDYEYSRITGSGEVNFNYQVQMPQHGFTFKGGINSDATVSGVTECRMKQLPLSIQFSGSINYLSHKSSVGLGISLD